jgi:hypothetical protein
MNAKPPGMPSEVMPSGVVVESVDVVKESVDVVKESVDVVEESVGICLMVYNSRT